LGGNLYADEVNFDRDWLNEARRYFTNIVGKYGVQVQNLLKKAANLDIQMICPLHGPIWRENLQYFIQKHDLWSKYEPESKSVVIVYGSPYGHTESAATVLANMLAQKGVKDVRMFDVSGTHVSYLVAEAFRCSHIVLASATYNGGLFPPMETFMLDLQAHALQNRTFAIVENGTWAPQAAKEIQAIMAEMKNNNLLEPIVSIKSSLKNEQLPALQQLADAIVSSL
jgi:flavorubredoxin